MEQLNRIELRGIIGSVRVQTYNGRKVAKFTVATNYAYRGLEGEPIIETTWHNVSAWENKDIGSVDRIQKGSKVYVTGRIKTQKYTDAEGKDKYWYEVIAYKITIIDNEALFQYEM